MEHEWALEVRRAMGDWSLEGLDRHLRFLEIHNTVASTATRLPVTLFALMHPDNLLHEQRSPKKSSRDWTCLLRLYQRARTHRLVVNPRVQSWSKHRPYVSQYSLADGG